ncbi:AfsR/SARP family transcriptional regulator [Nonomuraea cypriaca]|nr:AfsR/SARP family transcriptional regulator [Nonomuraea cypriaca]
MTGFRLLGPVGVWTRGELLGPSTPQQRSVLAMLLLHRGRTVSTDRLVEALWDDRPPASARNAVQGYVSRLRRVLAGLTGVELATSPPGYRLDVDPSRVDLYRFRDLVGRARAAGPERAGPLLRQALDLWSGPPLAGVAGGWLHEMFGQMLAEERLTAVEERIALDLRYGRRRESLPELSMLLSEHPLRERLAYLTMTALYDDGRGAAALEVFRDTRRRLVGELGVEPGAELQDLRRHILQGEPAGLPVPAELPRRRPASLLTHRERE